MTRSLPPAPRWISFDCYGTLIDWEQGVRRACRDLVSLREEEAAEFFSVWERMQWETLRGPYLPYAEILRSSFRRTMERLGYRSVGYAAEAFVDSLARWEPFSDANPVLIRLSQRYKLALISNIDRQLLGGSLRRLTVRFDAMITAEDARAYKPDPAIFRYALQKIGCAPQEIVHVAFGADYDLQPASAVGFRIVCLNRRRLPRPDAPLEAEIHSLDELLGLWAITPASQNQAAAATSERRGAEP